MADLLPLSQDNTNENKKLSLFPQNDTSFKNSPYYQEDLANKYDIALGQDSPGSDIVLSSIKTNTSNRLAELLAQRRAVELQNARNGIIQQIAEQGNVDTIDINVVQGLSQSDIESPDINTILDQEYAKKLTELQLTLKDEEDGTLSDSVEDPISMEKSYDAIDRTEYQTARNLIATTILDSTRHRFEGSGFLEHVDAYAQQIVPFRSWYTINNSGIEAPTALLPGDTKEKIYAYLNTLPPSEVKKQLETFINLQAESSNYIEALSFLEGYLSYSNDDKNWENIFAGIDLATTIPVAKLVKGLKGVGKAVSLPTKETEAMAAVANLPREAAKASIVKALNEGKLPGQDIKGIADAEKLVFSISRPQELFNGSPLRAGAAVTSRLAQAAVARAGKAIEILTGVNRVERLTPEEIELGYTEAQKFLEDNFVHANHQIVDVRRNAAEDTIGNTYSVTIQIGKKDGTPMPTKLGAQNIASRIKLRTNDYKVVELPTGGWVVEVTRPVDESSKGLRRVTVSTDSKLPDNWKTRFLGKVLGADNLLSRSQTQARGVAVASSENMSHLLEEFSKPFASMTKNERKEFEEFVIRDRDFVDPKLGRGVTRNTLQEFEEAFFDTFGKLPSEAQIDSYSSFRQLYDLDWLVRDLDVYKQKTVMGIEDFSFRVKGEEGFSDVAFEGKEVTDIPRGSKSNFRIAIVDDEGNISKYIHSMNRNEKTWDEISQLQKDNYKIIQAFEGSTKIGGKNVNFVMVRHFKRSNVSLGSVNYHKGSRVINKSPWYGKQANISNSNGHGYYNGDLSIFNGRSYEEAVEIAKKFNEARLMVKNRTKGVKKFFDDNLPMYSLKKFMTGVKTGAVSLDSPIKVVKSGNRVLDSHPNLVDEMRNEGVVLNSLDTDNEFDLSRQVTGRFLGERGETNMRTYGVEKNGTLFELDSDPLLSPLDTLRYSMGNMVNTHVVGDYRLKSVRDFTRQFADILDGDQASFDTEGLSYIFEPRYASGANPNRVKSAEAIRTSILSLFNNHTFLEKQIDMYKERVVRSLRNKFGDNVADFVGDKALPAAANADNALRAFAFHTKMGFFNIRQFFLQSTAAINVMAISPVHGTYGARATWPLIFSMNTKSRFVKEAGDKLAKVTGLSGDELEELTNLYKRSGFYHVGGDVAYIDNMQPPSLTKGKVKNVLEAGTVFFKGGETVSRTMAFATAFSERKALLKGTAPLEQGKIRYYYGALDHDWKPGSTTKDQWLTPTYEYARDYRKGSKDNKVWYVDLTKDQAISNGLYDEVNNTPILGKVSNVPSLRSIKEGSKLSRADEAWILQRAKDLTGNMTRDANAAYQKGWGSVLTQFFGYQMRLMEQMLNFGPNKKLTGWEKARLFTSMSLVYGVPVATGMTVGVWPMREWLKDELQKNNIQYDNTIAEPFIDGFFSTFLEAITGTDYDVSSSYGPGGLTTFYDLLKGDAELTDILLGASGGIVWDTGTDAANGPIRFLGEAFNPDVNEQFPVLLSDVNEVLRNISTVNNLTKLWEGVFTKRWMSQNETHLTDITETEALISAMFGVNPERVSDSFNKIEAVNALKELQNSAMKDMVIEYKRAFQLLKDGFPKEAQQHISRAKARGVTAGLSVSQRNDVYRRASDDTPLDQSMMTTYEKYFNK